MKNFGLNQKVRTGEYIIQTCAEPYKVLYSHLTLYFLQRTFAKKEWIHRDFFMNFYASFTSVNLAS